MTARPETSSAVRAALARYRVMAYVTGIWLLVLVFVAMPVKYLAGDDRMVNLVGPVHGFIFMVFLAAAYQLSLRDRWPLRRTVAVMLAGTVPFLSFVAERRVTRLVRGGRAAPALAGQNPARASGTAATGPGAAGPGAAGPGSDPAVPR